LSSAQPQLFEEPNRPALAVAAMPATTTTALAIRIHFIESVSLLNEPSMALDVIGMSITAPANSVAFPVAIRVNCSVTVEFKQQQLIQHGLLHCLDSWPFLSTEQDSALEGVGSLFLNGMHDLTRQSYRSFRLGKPFAGIRPE
jgi:hypothetical protein